MNKKLLAVLLTGLATGVVATLLVSSKTGKKMQKKLMKQGSDLAGTLKRQFNEFVDRAGDHLHSGSGK